MPDLRQVTQALGLGSGIHSPYIPGSCGRGWDCLPGCCPCHLEILVTSRTPVPSTAGHWPLVGGDRPPCSACRGQSQKLKKFCTPGIQEGPKEAPQAWLQEQAIHHTQRCLPEPSTAWTLAWLLKVSDAPDTCPPLPLLARIQLSGDL